MEFPISTRAKQIHFFFLHSDQSGLFNMLVGGEIILVIRAVVLEIGPS